MQIVTKLNKIWTQLSTWVYRKLDDRIWTERLNKALFGLSEEDRLVYQPILQNQIHAQRSFIRFNSNYVPGANRSAVIKQDQSTFNIAVRVLKLVLELKPLVGIQPLQAPVGTAYLIGYQHGETVDGMISPSKLAVVGQAIEAKTRKLRTRYTVEVAHDLMAVRGIDMQLELEQALAYEIAYEIIAEVFTKLKSLAENSSNVMTIKAPDFSTGYFSSDNSPEYTFERLGLITVGIGRLANNIAFASRRGPGNWLVANAAVISLLQSMPQSTFVPGSNHDNAESAQQIIQFCGTLNGAIRVYYTPVIGENEILIGYKGGSGQVDAGYIYCPYVPVVPFGVMVDPTTYAPHMVFGTRFGEVVFDMAKDNGKTTDLISKSEQYYVMLTFGEPEQFPKDPVDQQSIPA